ncbi:hypothetical protein CEXT_71031 [Caerostris extrusa]|uniref:Uncharacterized protein n=1 Tax=Caerostris extrusa TaxID=172846 RepID=A0AAV4MT86_CAEEX|nr:hypothetical protein CEXT_71031 [Caerostris extrusa]
MRKSLSVPIPPSNASLTSSSRQPMTICRFQKHRTNKRKYGESGKKRIDKGLNMCPRPFDRPIGADEFSDWNFNGYLVCRGHCSRLRY